MSQDLRHTGWWTIRQIQMDAASMEKNKRDLLSQHFCFFFLETKIEMVFGRGINLIKSILQLNINESPFWWELFYWCDASRPLSDWIMPITSCQIRLTGPRRKPARGVVINLEHQICSGELEPHREEGVTKVYIIIATHLTFSCICSYKSQGMDTPNLL